MSTAPNPIVVRVFAKGGVDFVPLQQAIAHDLKCLMEGRPDDASTIAGVFNNSIEAAAYVPTLKRTLREAREKRAAEAAAASSGDRNNCAWNVPATGNDQLRGTSNFEESAPMVRP